MPWRGRYYLGRVVKIPPTFTHQQFIDSLRSPKPIYVGEHGWTITGYHAPSDGASTAYVFGKLTKFKPEGSVNVVDTMRHSEVALLEQNLSIAASPFVYIPRYSGIAYLHVWNAIERHLFVKRFEKIVEASNDSFFVECHIEAISDLRTFAQKLSRLKRIEAIESKINPPNPLFGPLWASLRDYLKERRAVEMEIEERAPAGTELRSNISAIVDQVLRGDKIDPGHVAIGDAAVLMAADGYGKSKVIGDDDHNHVVVRTSDTVKSFLFDKQPAPDELYEEATRAFEAVNRERDLSH